MVARSSRSVIRNRYKKSQGIVQSEDGSVLLVALGIIVLLFVVVVGIFYFALDTQKNMVLADRFTKLKDAKSYAIEESKTRLMTYFDEETRKIIDAVSEDRKSTRLNSSHHSISYAVFCLKKKK